MSEMVSSRRTPEDRSSRIGSSHVHEQPPSSEPSAAGPSPADAPDAEDAEDAKHAKISSWLDQVHCGDSATVLKQIPEHSVDCVITSPPYYQQRDYGSTTQLGQEPTPAEYIARLQSILREVSRVLKRSGSLWLVLGDKYHQGAQLGIPWRTVIALQEEGWILRSDVIWHKPNAMPSAVKNRPTTDHEYVFLLTQDKSYYYNADAIREPHVTFTPASKMRGGRRHFHQRGGTPEQGKNGQNSNLHDGRWDQAFHPKGRNKRTVWSIPLSKFRGAHFAVFPESLVTTCLLASCPPEGVVLDPFLGSGTTAVVAAREGRHFIGIDCSPSYCELARDRLRSSSRLS